MSYVQNPLVSWLRSHSYGQGGTVAVPSASSEPTQALIGEFPPGINELLNHLVDRYSSWTTSAPEIDWCFLVGGPGNGKSEALRLLAGCLDLALPSRANGQPVPRTIPVGWPATRQPLASGLSPAFVNDASIPRPASAATSSAGSLQQDIRDALQETTDGRTTALFVNVNRGILVEECARINTQSSGPADQLAAGIIQWLSMPQGSPPTEGLTPGSLPTPTAPYYAQLRVDLSVVGLERSVVIHVVFLDMLSLLEPRPGHGGPSLDFSSDPPIASPYQTLGKFKSDDVGRESTIAGELVGDYVADHRWQDGGCTDPATGELCQAHPMCPIAQNASWLQAISLRRRFLDTLRAAEIAAGRRLTYRDLLGHISLALIGQPRQAWLSGLHPCTWVAQQHQSATTGGDKRAIVELASTRIYSNVFPTTGFPTSKKTCELQRTGDTVFGAIVPLLLPSAESARPRPLERAFHEIDPARDSDRWNGNRARVLDAVESLDISIPSAQLAGWAELPAAVFCELERVLDQVLREEIASELPQGSAASVARVRKLRRWRSTMLLRQIGLALGHVRFASAVEAWLAEQENALNDGPRMRLGNGINNLILPSGGTGRVFLAPYRPRTYCLVGKLPQNTILVAVNVSDLEVVIAPNGDTLSAEVHVRTRQQSLPPLATLPIDLAVAREALLHSQEKTGSFTEIGDAAFARIERARASLIGRQRLENLQACYIDEQQKVFQISLNPTSQPPLRVQQQ